MRSRWPTSGNCQRWTMQQGSREWAKPNLKHGMRYTPEYNSWTKMKRRCLKTTDKDFPRWGGRGVTICEEWITSFEAFYAHIGPRPDGTSLDRIDNRLGYCPGNVRWATAQQQQRNRPGAYQWNIKGLSFDTAEEAAAHFNVSKHSVWRWVRGQHDKRRNHFDPPREDCHVVSRY